MLNNTITCNAFKALIVRYKNGYEVYNINCFPNNVTVRVITNSPATVRDIGGKFYIIEQGTIDTRQNPCTLAQEFQVDNLQVTFSGEVKSTIQNGPVPCCTENLVVTQISR